MLPTLRTPRLTLRPFTAADAPQVQQLSSAYEVALNTAAIPHPYPDGAAEEWIARHDQDFEQNRLHTFAIDDGRVAGAMSLVMRGDAIAELGYWLGVPFWGRGYATEAGRAVLRYGFEECALHRIYACHYTRNAASGGVIRKLGMTYEGTLRHHARKWDVYVNVACYGILVDEWREESSRAREGASPAVKRHLMPRSGFGQ